MAHNSFVKPSFTIPSLLLAAALLIFLSSARTVQISDICSKHSNPSNCATILNTVPGAASGADLYSLSHYLITLAHAYAFDTITTINEFIRNTTTDQQLRQRYISCNIDYINVLDSLNRANDSHGSGDFNGMRSDGQDLIKDVQDCDGKQPYDPSALPNRNKYLEDVGGIIVILADFLAGKY